MAHLKEQEAKEIKALEVTEKKVERRERIHHILIGSLAALLGASIVAHVLRCYK